MPFLANHDLNHEYAIAEKALSCVSLILYLDHYFSVQSLISKKPIIVYICHEIAAMASNSNDLQAISLLLRNKLNRYLSFRIRLFQFSHLSCHLHFKVYLTLVLISQPHHE